MLTRFIHAGVVVFLSVGCATTLTPTRNGEALCTRVIDGDTVEIRWAGGLDAVRLVGIDAPETRRGKRLNEQAEKHGLSPEEMLTLGQSAKKRLVALVEGREVTVVWSQGELKRGRNCRLQAFIEIDNMDAAEILIREGLAWPNENEKCPHPRIERYRRVINE